MSPPHSYKDHLLCTAGDLGHCTTRGHPGPPLWATQHLLFSLTGHLGDTEHRSHQLSTSADRILRPVLSHPYFLLTRAPCTRGERTLGSHSQVRQSLTDISPHKGTHNHQVAAGTLENVPGWGCRSEMGGHDEQGTYSGRSIWGWCPAHEVLQEQKLAC